MRRGAAVNMFTTSAVVLGAAGVLALGQSRWFSFTTPVLKAQSAPFTNGRRAWVARTSSSGLQGATSSTT